VDRPDSNQGVKPSLLDRLIDPYSSGTAWRHGYGVEQMTATVLRDLDDLLNTRQSQGPLAEKYPELSHSVFSYGLPELTSFEDITPQQRVLLSHMIETIISVHEPRLRDVRATMVDPGDGKDRTVRFRIDARLCLDPAPDVAFDTVLELTTGRYKVQPRGV
jgi:type VI secretion system protein ImpF